MDYGTAYQSKAVDVSPMPIPGSPAALSELADAARNYAVAAEGYISARHNWTEARARYQHLLDQVTSVIEKENV